jgi:hypothetical protein
MAVPRAASVDWQAPSGASYVIETGPAPTPEAAKVVLQDSNGAAIATEPLGGGHYLVYAPAQVLPPTVGLVFYDAAGHVVDQFTVDLTPLGQPTASAATP